MADKKISGTHRPHRLTSQEHYSDAFLTSAFLALSGGLQDAYTYNTRDGVFSNAQTGNVVNGGHVCGISCRSLRLRLASF